jgi:hypothetical protein
MPVNLDQLTWHAKSSLIQYMHTQAKYTIKPQLNLYHVHEIIYRIYRIYRNLDQNVIS